MGKITALILVFLLSLSPVFSEVALGEPQQAQRNYWATEAECLAVVGAPWYYPEPRKCALKPNEDIVGLPANSCVQMDLPNNLGVGDRGWVPIEAGRRFVRDKRTGILTRLEECCNDVQQVVPFPVKVAIVPPPPQVPAIPVIVQAATPNITIQMPSPQYTVPQAPPSSISLTNSPTYTPSGGGIGKGGIIGIITAGVVAALCIWKCKGSGGSGVNVTNITNVTSSSPTDNSSPTIGVPPPANNPPLGPIGIPTPATGGTATPGTGVAGTSPLPPRPPG